MKSSIARRSLVFLIPAALLACDSPRSDWAQPGATAPISAQAVPKLVEVAKSPAPPPAQAPEATKKPHPEPIVTVAPKVDLDAKLAVKRLVLAEAVKDREPVASGTLFSTRDDRIYAFVEIENPSRADSEIFVSFAREGEKEGGRIPLRVGASPRWRTWAFTRLADEPGRWEAIVRNARGHEIGRASFEIADSAADAPTAAVKRMGEPHI